MEELNIRADKDRVLVLLTTLDNCKTESSSSNRGVDEYDDDDEDEDEDDEDEDEDEEMFILSRSLGRDGRFMSLSSTLVSFSCFADILDSCPRSCVLDSCSRSCTLE